MNKKVRLLIAMSLTVIVMSLLITAGFKNSSGSYLTIEEALAMQNNGATQSGKFIQMEGNLAPDSAVWDQDQIRLNFGLTDGNNTIKVVYNSVKPDNFDSGYPIIVEGKFTSEKEFVAEKVLVKCPSKYEEATE